MTLFEKAGLVFLIAAVVAMVVLIDMVSRNQVDEREALCKQAGGELVYSVYAGRICVPKVEPPAPKVRALT